MVPKFNACYYWSTTMLEGATTPYNQWFELYQMYTQIFSWTKAMYYVYKIACTTHTAFKTF